MAVKEKNTVNLVSCNFNMRSFVFQKVQHQGSIIIPDLAKCTCTTCTVHVLFMAL